MKIYFKPGTRFAYSGEGLKLMQLVVEEITGKSIEELAIEKKIEQLLAQMTLQEKVSQMINIGLPSLLKGDYWDVRDSTVFAPKKFHKFITKYAVGSIHNTPGYLLGSKEWYTIVKEIQDSALTKTRLGIPLIYGIDNIHGANYVKESVLFPQQIAPGIGNLQELTVKLQLMNQEPLLCRGILTPILM